ncbi:MAG TPA: MFS transporter [Candidatus Dadabacteria bacterium]|nr:MFS transporter [Candidatus Dadabacteria bacterium]
MQNYDFNKNFFLATFSNCFFFVNFSCFFLLPLFLDQTGYSKSDIGIVMSTFGFSSILLTPYTATLIDRYGKKILCLIALALMIASSLCFIFVSDFILIIFLRIIQGAAFSVFFNSSSAIASNNLNDDKKQVGLSFFSSFTIISYFLGPFFSEKIIIQFGFTEFFIYASAFSLMSLILVLFIEERDSERDSTADVLSFFKIIKDENIFNYLFANFLLASGFGVVMNFLSLFLKNNDLTVGYFFISYSVVVSLVRIFFADRFSSKNLFKKVLLMLTLFAATLFFIPYIDSKSDIILFSVLFSLTYSLVYPFLSSIVVTGKSQALTGRLFGALNSSFSIGVNLMTFFYGFIAEIWGFNTMFQVASVLIFLGVGFVFTREGRVV